MWMLSYADIAGSGDRNKAAQEDALRKYLANAQKGV
jgi:hypothetical protein